MNEVKLGGITLHNMDCMDYLKTLPDNAFDLAIVDPPYGISITSSGRLKKYNSKNTSWDDYIPDKIYFDEIIRVSKNQIIWGANYFLDYLGNTKSFVIWDKKQPENVSFASCEFAWTSFDSVAKSFYYSPMQQKNRIHPTQKPVKLYEWLLSKYAKEGDRILDTHLGSGSIAIACHNAGYELTGIELDKEYFNNAVKRISEHQKQLTLF